MKAKKELPKYLEVITYLIFGTFLSAVNLFIVFNIFSSISKALLDVLDLDYYFAIVIGVLTFVIFVEAVIISIFTKRQLPGILSTTPLLVSITYIVFSLVNQRNYPELLFDNLGFVLFHLLYNGVILAITYLGTKIGVRLSSSSLRNMVLKFSSRN